MTFLGSGIPVPKSLFATDGGTVQAEPQVQTSYICRGPPFTTPLTEGWKSHFWQTHVFNKAIFDSFFLNRAPNL